MVSYVEINLVIRYTKFSNSFECSEIGKSIYRTIELNLIIEEF